MESTEVYVKKKHGGSAAEADHYRALRIQPIEVIQKLLSTEELFGFLHGNIIKYAMRCGHKEAASKDMEKLIQYAKWYIQVWDGETIDPNE